MQLILGYFAFINLLAFALFGIDKYKAIKNTWRIRETALILSAALGGSLGALVAMKLFYHKTRHKKFTITIPLLLIAQIAFLIWYYPYIPMPLKLS